MLPNIVQELHVALEEIRNKALNDNAEMKKRQKRQE